VALLLRHTPVLKVLVVDFFFFSLELHLQPTMPKDLGSNSTPSIKNERERKGWVSRFVIKLGLY
jgi:hypothetical protein